MPVAEGQIASVLPSAGEPCSTPSSTRSSGGSASLTESSHGSAGCSCIGIRSRAATAGTSPPWTTTDPSTTTKTMS